MLDKTEGKCIMRLSAMTLLHPKMCAPLQQNPDFLINSLPRVHRLPPPLGGEMLDKTEGKCFMLLSGVTLLHPKIHAPLQQNPDFLINSIPRVHRLQPPLGKRDAR